MKFEREMRKPPLQLTDTNVRIVRPPYVTYNQNITLQRAPHALIHIVLTSFDSLNKLVAYRRHVQQQRQRMLDTFHPNLGRRTIAIW